MYLNFMVSHFNVIATHKEMTHNIQSVAEVTSF